MTAPNLDPMQMMNMYTYGANGFDAKNMINMFGSQIGGQSYNDIAWFANSIETLGNGTPQQKAQTIQMGINKLFSMFASGMGVKEGKNSSVETDTHRASAQQVIDNQKQEMNRLEGEINTINTEIESRLDIINQEIQNIETQGEKLTEQQEAAKAKQEEISKKQEELNSATSNEDKVRILNEILTLTGELKAIVENITSNADSLNESNDIVESNNSEIENLASQSTDVITTGTDNISQGISAGTASLAEGQSDLQISGQDTKAGTELQIKAAGTALGTLGFGSAQAAQMELDAAGYFTGAGNRATGGAAVLGLANNGIGSWNNMLPVLTNFENGIGQYTNLSSGYLGDFSNSYTNLTGMITTIGTQVNTTDSLTAAVKSDITTLEGEDENSSATELETNKVELEEIEA